MTQIKPQAPHSIVSENGCHVAVDFDIRNLLPETKQLRRNKRSISLNETLRLQKQVSLQSSCGWELIKKRGAILHIKLEIHGTCMDTIRNSWRNPCKCVSKVRVGPSYYGEGSACGMMYGHVIIHKASVCVFRT